MEQGSFKKTGWNFKEILSAAKDIKPAGWIVVANNNSNRRLSFMEVSLGERGPASIKKELVLEGNMKMEVYVVGQKVADDVLRFRLSKIRSASELSYCLNLFSSYGVCQGNKNFKRINKNGEIVNTDYWKDTNCHKLYDKALKRPENCCDACLELNQLLPKKINNVHLSLSQPIIPKSFAKRRSQANAELTKIERQKSGKRKKSETDNQTKQIKQEVEETEFIPTHFVSIKEEPLF